MPGKATPGKAAVMGLGLIGGSMAAALRGRGWWVAGCSRKPEARTYALNQGIVDAVAAPPLAVAEAELVVLAGPPHALADMARDCAPGLAPGALVTDVASVKGQLGAQIRACLPPGANYVGGHPMAGSEQQGIQSSDPELLSGAPYIITWDDNTYPPAVLRLAAIVRSLGCTPYLLSPEEHDRLLAVISHLPHLAAATLALVAAGEGGRDIQAAARLAAGGFRDTTRVAAGSPQLWRQIALDNRQQLLGAMDRLQELLDCLRGHLVRADDTGVEAFLEQARSSRQGIIKGRIQQGGN